jgi:hypothetical protein
VQVQIIVVGQTPIEHRHALMPCARDMEKRVTASHQLALDLIHTSRQPHNAIQVD